MVCTTPPFQEESTHQIWDSYLKKYRQYAPDTIILETRLLDQGHSDLKMVHNISPSKDASIKQILGYLPQMLLTHNSRK